MNSKSFKNATRNGSDQKLVTAADVRKVAQSLADDAVGQMKPPYQANLLILKQRKSIELFFGYDSVVLALYELYVVQRTTDSLPHAYEHLITALKIFNSREQFFRCEINATRKLLRKSNRIKAEDRMIYLNTIPKIVSSITKSRQFKVMTPMESLRQTFEKANVTSLPSGALPRLSQSFGKSRAGFRINTSGANPYC